MSLDIATVRRIATLARIEVPEADLEATAAQLSGILSWIEQLREVNTDHVAPMSGGLDTSDQSFKLPWRADQVTDGDQAQAVAPGVRKGGLDGVVAEKPLSAQRGAALWIALGF